MVKFKATQLDGRILIGIGLSAENIKRLKDGKPIHMNLEALDLPWRADLTIMYGETEIALAEELSEFIGPETIVTKDGKPQ